MEVLMKRYFLLFIACIAGFISCQTTKTQDIENTGWTGSPINQYLVPINNNVLSGSIQNFYKATDENLLEPILWIFQERS
jgi:hypothetical protein